MARQTKFQQRLDEICALTGYSSEKFDYANEVREYFQRDTLVKLFYDDGIPSQEYLDELANIILAQDDGTFTAWMRAIEADTTDSRIAQLAADAYLDDDQPLRDRRDALAEAADEREVCCFDGGADVDITVRRSPGQSWEAAAEEAVADDWSDGDWGCEGRSYLTIGWHWATSDLHDGKWHSVEIVVGEDPEEPGCTEDEHEWCSPVWLGGCRENPGVWALQGTQVTHLSVCRHCGAYRRYTSESTPGNCPRQPERTEYREPDEDSLRWVAENREVVS